MGRRVAWTQRQHGYVGERVGFAQFGNASNGHRAAYARRVQELSSLDPNPPLGNDAASRTAMLKGIAEVIA